MKNSVSVTVRQNCRINMLVDFIVEYDKYELRCYVYSYNVIFTHTH